MLPLFRFTLELLFSRTALFVLVVLFVPLAFLLRVCSVVALLRVTLLRVLLGRLYTRWALLVRRTVRSFCAVVLLSLRAIVPVRTPLSALAGPVARGT